MSRLVQGDQLNMAVCFSHLVSGTSDLPNVHVYSSVHWTSHFLQGTRKTWPCISGRPVYKYFSDFLDQSLCPKSGGTFACKPHLSFMFQRNNKTYFLFYNKISEII